jgi:hemolysin III
MMSATPANPESDSPEQPTDSGAVHLPLLEESLEYEKHEPKPSWRGWIHLATLPIAVVAGVVLVALAEGTPAVWSSAVFALSSVLLFGISGTYHRFSWGPAAKKVLRRLDHANIFLLIAGTYTPIAVVALPPEKGWLLLGLVWGGALLGIGFRVFWLGAPRWVYVPLYLALGWAAVMYIGDLFAANAAMMVLVIVGGLAYSLGAVVYATKWPNPSPAHFGFHEIFHALTVVAFLSHWSAVLLVAINPPLVG